MSSQNNQKKKSSSGTPVAIIVVVLILAVVGCAWFYNSSKSTGNTNKASVANVNRAQQSTPNPANAPVGAALGINMLGSPTATVTVEEFADFQCPSCAGIHPVMKEIQGAYAGNKNVRFIFRHFPLPMHDKSFEAATAVEAAGMQSSTKFWTMMDQLMSNQTAWANNPNYRQLWLEYAGKIGLDVPKFQAEAAGLAARGRVDLDSQRAKGLGVSSTPSVYINGKLIPFADVNLAAMKQVIDAELQNAAAKPAVNAPNVSAAGNKNAGK